ncbi:MAG: hypothetical protein RBT63_03980, partial [Bdellovibrionales bacterium]|nr:hypothetical protein [Bdellovibrionales bacterium]
YSIFLVERPHRPGAPPTIITGASKTKSAPAAPVYVGRLDIAKTADTMKLEILNPKTGEAAEVISLQPVR